MPFRNRQTLEEWLDEFRALGYPLAGSLKVMAQDGDGGADTGLVGVQLANASTVTYVQPEAPHSSKWVATMESRDEEVVLDSVELMGLASELTVLSALCAFLEAKSEAHARPDVP